MTVVLTIIVLIAFSYYKTANEVESKNNIYVSQSIAEINKTISSNCDIINNEIENICYNKEFVQEYLNASGPSDKFNDYTRLKSYISDMANMKSGIIDIAIFGNDGNSFNINGDLINIAQFKSQMPPQKLYYYLGFSAIPYNSYERNCFIAGAQIYSTSNYEKRGSIGTLLMVLDVNTLIGGNSSLSNLNGTIIYMVDRSNRVFFTNDGAMKLGDIYREDLESNQDYIIQSGQIPDLDGKIIFAVPKKQLLCGVDDIKKQELIALLIVLALLSFPAMVVSGNLIRPLHEFMSFMSKIGEGNLTGLKKHISLSGYAEITKMSDVFNNMLDEINSLTHQLITTNSRLHEAEMLKEESEVKYLQSQINPHFLYNTLESIKGVAVEEKSDRIFRMAKALGEIFRYSIKTVDSVLLAEELKIVESYLYIQKVRFGPRLEVEYHIEEEARSVYIFKMLLQPIIENAVIHGIEPKLNVGHILIRVSLVGNSLEITVRDDGVGIEQESLDKIQKSLAEEERNKNRPFGEIPPRSRTIGLINVNSRIRLAYGDQYGVKIASRVGEGTKVTIVLPARRQGNV